MRGPARPCSAFRYSLEENLAFIIKDTETGEVYQLQHGRNGWYDRDPTYARRYRTREGAERTIKAGNHHVSYPGNRKLIVTEE